MATKPVTHRQAPVAGYEYSGYRVFRKDRTHLADGYKGDGNTYYPVVIVGAAASGLCMGWKLKEKLGIDQFKIFDRQSGIGGTWWINTYPNVACDVPAAFYSFSFAQNSKWRHFYPGGAEIYDYFQEVADKYGLTDKIQLNTDVVDCKWVEKDQEWEVLLQHLVPGTGDLSHADRQERVKELGEYSVYVSREIIRTKVLISGVGGLVEPNVFPNVPGVDTFGGSIFHSARWNHDVDFTDKNVVVIGTGCTAAQFVPCLTKAPFNAKQVTQIMRSPPWVEPRVEAPFGEEGWAKIAPVFFTYVPGALRLLRFAIFAGAEAGWSLFGDSAYNARIRSSREGVLNDRMRKLAPEKYHEMLTPDYSIACKRRIFDDKWYLSLNQPNMELTTMPLTSIQETSVTLGPGKQYPESEKAKNSQETKTVPADIIVLANGFQTHQYLHPLKVTGEGGKDLIETMNERGGPQTYQGLAMDGFPNFFMIFGPNTATGHSSVIMAIENMVDYIAPFVKLVVKGEAKTVDVKKEAEVAYTTDIQHQLKKTVWMKGGCSSWYFTKDGWNPTVLPYNQIWFWYRCQWIKWSDWNINYTKKGLIKLIISRGLKLATIIVVALMVRRSRASDLTLQEQIDSWKQVGIMAALLALDKAKKRVLKLM